MLQLHFLEFLELPKFGDGNSNNFGGNSGNEGPASLEQDLIESLAPGQFTAESTLTHGFPNKPTGKSFLTHFCHTIC